MLNILQNTLRNVEPATSSKEIHYIIYGIANALHATVKHHFGTTDHTSYYMLEPLRLYRTPIEVVVLVGVIGGSGAQLTILVNFFNCPAEILVIQL